MSERWKRLAQGGEARSWRAEDRGREGRGEREVGGKKRGERQRGEGKSMEWMSEGVFF